jgi:hypothetical protein
MAEERWVILVCRECGKPSDAPIGQGCECPDDGPVFPIYDPVVVVPAASTESKTESNPETASGGEGEHDG